jgi:hypothetical protein
VPVAAWYTPEATANEKTCWDQRVEHLPVGGLLLFDLGFFRVCRFDALTEAQKCFVTRLRRKTASRVVTVLRQGPRYRDEIMQRGLDRSTPCRYPVRQISVWWKQTWHHSLTNGLDPQILSAQQVCALYRRRWRIEEAFVVTTRLVGLASLGVGGTNGVEMQIDATWIFSAVLTDLCQHVAHLLGQPLDRIAVAMVCRGLYHFRRAWQNGESTSVVSVLVEHARLLGIGKALRTRHKPRDLP